MGYGLRVRVRVTGINTLECVEHRGVTDGNRGVTDGISYYTDWL